MILEKAKKKLIEVIENLNIYNKEIVITCKALTPEEAIGNPIHDDYPIQLGKERIIEADFMGKKGHAFSDSYFNYRGTVGDILALNLETNARRAIFVSSLNAIMAYFKKISEAIHCKDEDLMKCADHFFDFVKTRFVNANNFLLVGLQPRLLEKLTLLKNVKVCDLNPDNIGKSKYGVVVDGPEKFFDNAEWANVIFATGSTVVNGTIDEIVKANRDAYFYGVTIAGIANLLELNHFCFMTGIS